MKFDDITTLLGEFGKYQKVLYLLICLPTIFTSMQMMSPVFILSIPDHRCKIPDWSNDTFEVMNDEHRAAINRSIPWEKDDDDYVYSSCNVYRTDVNTTYSVSNIPVNSSTMECDSWVYDDSVFETTFITKTDLICGSEIARANANMIMFGGVMVGAIVIGIFSDIFGRKPAVILSAFIHIAAAFGSAFAPNYAVFVTMRFFIGLSNMGLFMSMFVIAMELVGPSKRVAAGVIINFFWCIGMFLLTLLAYFIRTWDKLLLALACPSVLLLLYFWLIPESPRWLILQGKMDKADKVIQKCAKVNNVTLPDGYLTADSADEGKKSSVLELFTSPRLLFRSLIIYFNWIVVVMVYYGLGLNVGNLNGDIYVNFAINTSMEVAAYIVCLVLLNRTGRKVLHAGTMILGGLATLATIFTVVYADESHDWITLVLSNVGKFGISAAFAIIYVWSAELFPTMVRNSGMGSSSMFARIGSMVSPYVADLGEIVEGPFGKALPLIIFGGLSVLAGLLSLLLPETNGKVLPETIEDAQNFGRDDVGTPKNGNSSKYYLNNAFDNIGETPVGYKQRI